MWQKQKSEERRPIFTPKLWSKASKDGETGKKINRQILSSIPTVRLWPCSLFNVPPQKNFGPNGGTGKEKHRQILNSMPTVRLWPMTCSMCQSNKPLNGHCSHRDGGVTYSSLSSFLSRLKIYYYCSHTQHIDIFYLIFSGGVGGLFAFVDLWIFLVFMRKRVWAFWQFCDKIGSKTGFLCSSNGVITRKMPPWP